MDKYITNRLEENFISIFSDNKESKQERDLKTTKTCNSPVDLNKNLTTCGINTNHATIRG
jgi:hypothetical protein